LKFFKPDTHTNKAVAVGAVSFYIDRFVTGRISKFTYGVPCVILYEPLNPEHTKRNHKSYVDVRGDKRLPAFSTMLSKGTKVLENQEIRTGMHMIHEGAPPMDALSPIMRYNGDRREPRWVDIERDKFETLCNVVADISTAPYMVMPGKTGKVCYSRTYEVVLLVGLTELKAQICWIDSATGIEKRSDATVVYEGVSENSRTGPRVISRYDGFDPVL